jgi:adenylylsulfate kinase-like enzyme
MSVRTYDPKSVSVLVGGVPIHGFATGLSFTLNGRPTHFQKLSESMALFLAQSQTIQVERISGTLRELRMAMVTIGPIGILQIMTQTV